MTLAPRRRCNKASRAIEVSRRSAGAALVGAGAALVAASGFVVWLDVLGSRLSGYRLAELLTTFGDDLTGVPPGWVGLAWYLFPLVAAVSWLFVFLRSPASAVRAHVPMGLAIALAAAAYLLWVDSQPGPWLALAGGTAVFAGGLTSGSILPKGR